MKNQKQKRVFSGIQPTDDIHIGNYLGAIQNWVSLLDKHECIYCIVDYHAMTIDYKTESMASNIRNALLDSISLGLDPEKCILSFNPMCLRSPN